MTFYEYVTHFLNTPFKWGQHDCVTWAVGWVSTVAGKNLLEPFGSWACRRTAVSAIKAVGGLERAFDESSFLSRGSPNFAVDGDLFLVGKSAYLLSGEHLVGTGAQGLVFKNRIIGEKTWTYTKHSLE